MTTSKMIYHMDSTSKALIKEEPHQQEAKIDHNNLMGSPQIQNIVLAVIETTLPIIRMAKSLRNLSFLDQAWRENLCLHKILLGQGSTTESHGCIRIMTPEEELIKVSSRRQLYTVSETWRPKLSGKIAQYVKLKGVSPRSMSILDLRLLEAILFNLTPIVSRVVLLSKFSPNLILTTENSLISRLIKRWARLNSNSF